MTGDEVVQLGPIRPEHACDGWRLGGDEANGWCLYRPVGDLVAKVHGTTATTCAWGIYRPDGTMIREASWDDVDEAKALADKWIQERQ
jgi:hypothetical protein